MMISWVLKLETCMSAKIKYAFIIHDFKETHKSQLDIKLKSAVK